jgi:hypothetical protein
MVFLKTTLSFNLAIALLISTLLIAFLKLSNFENIYTVDPLQLSWTLVDDRSEGGASVASTQNENKHLVLVCDIKTSKNLWPYCSISFNLMRNQHGIDFSHYSGFRLWIKNLDEPPVGIRFQLRNFSSAYSDPGQDLSLKYNVVEFYQQSSPYPVVVPKESFQVPSWWMVLHKFSPERGAPEFTDVRSIDVATGYNILSGQHKILIERIDAYGKFMDDEEIYLILLLVWVTLGIFHLSKSILTPHKNIQ